MMSTITVSILILLIMILFNGFLSMTEMSVVSSKRAKIRINAEKGISGYGAVNKILQSPTRFLSTIQIGITCIGIIAGAFGEARISEHMALYLQSYGIGAEPSEVVSAAVVIILTTFFTILFGELIPKRIAMNNAEKIAVVAVYPVKTLSVIFLPFVKLLGFCSDAVMNFMPVHRKNEPVFEEEEVKLLLREGESYGLLKKYQADTVESILELNDVSVASIMIPRPDIYFLDISMPQKKVTEAVVEMSHFAYLPVCNKSIDHILGVVKTADVTRSILKKEKISIEKSIEKPVYLSEKASVLKAIETFNAGTCRAGIVIDEYGSITGMVTQKNIMDRLFAVNGGSHSEDEKAVKRKDGSYLIDAMMQVEDFADLFGITIEKQDDYHTLAGFILSHTGQIPKTGDSLRYGGLYIEVIDMDGKRIDKVLVKKGKSAK